MMGREISGQPLALQESGSQPRGDHAVPSWCCLNRTLTPSVARSSGGWAFPRELPIRPCTTPIRHLILSLSEFSREHRSRALRIVSVDRCRVGWQTRYFVWHADANPQPRPAGNRASCEQAVKGKMEEGWSCGCKITAFSSLPQTTYVWMWPERFSRDW